MYILNLMSVPTTGRYNPRLYLLKELVYKLFVKLNSDLLFHSSIFKIATKYVWVHR